MLAAGKLRVLSAGDPDPYPDSIHISCEDGAEEAEKDDGSCKVTKAKRRTRKTAIQKAVERLTA